MPSCLAPLPPARGPWARLPPQHVPPGAPAHTLPCCPALQDDDIPGIVRYRTYEVLKEEAANPRLR